MKGLLTEKYASAFEARGLKNVTLLLARSVSFVRDLHRNKKLRELTSFIVWEAMHKFGLFPKESYLEFNESATLTLEKEAFNALDTSENAINYFHHRGLAIVRAEQDWRVLFNVNGNELLGSLYSADNTLYRSSDGGASIVRVHEFPSRILSLYVSSNHTILVCLEGSVYRSADDGATFQKSLELSSPESYFRRESGITELPNGTLIIGEYGNVIEGTSWRNLAYLYIGSNNGESWQRSDFLKEQGANKHVHLVYYSKLLNRVVVADGDNWKRLWVSDPVKHTDRAMPALNLINRFHIQMGGHTSCIEINGKLLFGTDYMGGTNFILETSDCKTFTKKVIPDPYRKSPIMQLVPRRSKHGDEIWALLPYSDNGSRCLLMYSKDYGKSWFKAIEYHGATHGVQLVGSSSASTDLLYLSLKNHKTGERAVYKIGDA